MKYLANIIFVFLLLSVAPAALAKPVSVELSAPGLSSALQTTILDNISLYRQRNSPFLTDDYVERLYQRGPEEIRTTLKVFGYYQATVTGKLDRQDDAWQIAYSVDPGQPLRIKDVDLNISGAGQDDKKITQWVQDYPLHAGDVLNQQRYEQAKKTLQGLLLERGYFNSQLLNHEIQISMKNYYGNIVVHIDTGQRFRFGEVTFVQDDYDARYLKRFVPFEKGQYFTGEMLSQLQKNLASSGEFQSVEIAPLTDAATDEMVPVHITLVPRKPTRYTFGVGFGTDTGPRGRVGVERRHITNTGHRAEAEAFVSKVRFRLTANYRIPLTKPPYDYLLLSGERVVEDTGDTYSQSNKVSVNTVYGLKDWQRTASLAYLAENYRVAGETQDSSLLIPGIIFLYKPDSPRQLSQPLDYRWQFSISAKGAHENVASDVSFVQSRLLLGNRLKLTSDLNLVTRVDVGWTWVEFFDQLPVSQRFFAGGDLSVRGFAYNSIGPEDANGDVIGGDRLLVGSVEMQYQFSADKDVAVFFDAGNAYTGSHFNIERGAGIGMGWSLPFGVLRAYVANALSRPDHPWRPHLVVGADW